MMYKLTLRGDERAAFDWIGDRYNNGDKMADIIRRYPIVHPVIREDYDYWNEPGDVTFDLPEHAAWEIRELYEEDCEGGHSGWACFDRELTEKMQLFVDSIV